MVTNRKNIMVFAGNACGNLAKDIVDEIKREIFNLREELETAKIDLNDIEIKQGAIEVGQFSDGETRVHITESVRGKDVFIVQSTSYPTNDNLMELLVICDALRRASAGRITAVMPYFGYARQDRKARSRDPITAKLVADLITSAGANRVLTMDFHSPQLQGFFNIPVDHLYGAPVLTNHLINQGYKNNKDVVVVSPDLGSVKRAGKIAGKIECPLAVINKKRTEVNEVEIMSVIGDVKGKTCIMVDDMIDTAGTIVKGAAALVANGAKEVIACCTHPVLSGEALSKLENSVIKQVISLDTIEHKKQLPSKIMQISAAPIIASAITRISMGLPISALYDE